MIHKTLSRHNGVRTGAVWTALCAGLLLAMLFGVSCGAVPLPVSDLIAILLHRQPLSVEESSILFDIRLPRVIAAALAGAALSASGVLFQGLMRNPLADPYITGSSGGAVLGATIGMVLLPQITWQGYSAIAMLAFAGALGTIAIVYSLARVRGNTQVVTLLLAGFTVSTMLSNSSYFVEILDHNNGFGLRVLAIWLHGTIGTPRWNQLIVSGVLLLISLCVAMTWAHRLNSLALGDEYAQQLGLHVERVRISVILAASLLTAIAVSLGGLIGFVGLIIPHLSRLITGPDHLRLLPVATVTGAIFLVLTDTIARTVVAPSELPVGVLMAFIGGPFFLFMLRRTRGGFAS